MKVQIISHIHLEDYKIYPKITKKCDYLFLAGDIGKLHCTNYKEFIQYCNSTWKKTIVVLGNHEFYSSKKTYSDLLEKYTMFFSHFENVILLEKNKIQLEDYEVLGTTLWSHIESSVKTYINCPICIKTKKKNRNQGIGYELLNKLHEDSSTWIMSNYDSTKKTIILTHYPVTTYNTSHPKYNNDSPEMKKLFANEMQFHPSNQLVCISGHTHYSYDYIKDNIRYISNQMGYKDELLSGKSNFYDNIVFDI